MIVFEKAASIAARVLYVYFQAQINFLIISQNWSRKTCLSEANDSWHSSHLTTKSDLPWRSNAEMERA